MHSNVVRMLPDVAACVFWWKFAQIASLSFFVEQIQQTVEIMQIFEFGALQKRVGLEELIECWKMSRYLRNQLRYSRERDLQNTCVHLLVYSCPDVRMQKKHSEVLIQKPGKRRSDCQKSVTCRNLQGLESEPCMASHELDVHICMLLYGKLGC